MIRIWSTTEWEINKVSLQYQGNVFYNKIFTSEEGTSNNLIEIKCSIETDEWLSHVPQLEVYVDDEFVKTFYIAYPYNRGIWQYENVIITW